jgi:hypothetical protein
MKLTTVAAAAAVLVALAGASAAGSANTEPTADVENIATVVIGGLVTDFEFNLYDCPAGEPMAVEWQAQQPSGNSVVIGVQPVGTSSGANTQHLTVSAGGDFVAGERWVGSGTVFCGSVPIPVSGAGTTKSLNGV